MNTWGEYPFVRILFAFIAGNLLCIFTECHFMIWMLPLSIVLTLALHIIIRRKTSRLYKYSAVIGFSFQLCFFFFGNILTYEKIDEHQPEHFSRSLDSARFFIVKIKEPLIEKAKSFKAVAEVIKEINEHGTEKSCGNTIIYFKKDSAALRIRYGDLIMVKNNFHGVPAPKNPDEFDYGKYLWYHGIYCSAFVKDTEWKLLPEKSINPVYELTYHLRDLSLSAIQKYLPTEREASVAEALVIGYRDDMSSDIMQSYTAAGVVHVLAVSGLHVGILFALLHQLLFFLNRKRYGKILQSVIIITIIWIFALLTGLSGSVIRSAAMFSFITLGQNLKRSVNMNNTLACSAVTIMLFDPLMIMDVGFQLSYFAVFGISALSKYFDELLERENKIADHVWKTVSMSMAAQLITLPLTLFYFNQFPTYFLLANLVVIPAAGIILHLGIILIIIQFIHPVAAIVGKATWLITDFLNYFIKNIEQLPDSVIHLPSMTLMQAIILGIFISFICRYFITAQKKWLFAGLVSSVLFMGIQSVNSYSENSQRTMTLYSLPGKTNLEFRKGNKALLFQDGPAFSSNENIYLQKHWQLNSITATLKSFLDSAIELPHDHLLIKANCFQFYNLRIAVINKPDEIAIKDSKIRMDAVILCSNVAVTIPDVIKKYEPGIIIFDASNSPYQVRKWKRAAEELKIKTFDVNSDGAFILNI